MGFANLEKYFPPEACILTQYMLPIITCLYILYENENRGFYLNSARKKIIFAEGGVSFTTLGSSGKKLSIIGEKIMQSMDKILAPLYSAARIEFNIKNTSNSTKKKLVSQL